MRAAVTFCAVVAVGVAALIPAAASGSGQPPGSLAAGPRQLLLSRCHTFHTNTSCDADTSCSWNAETLQCDPTCALAYNATDCEARACYWDPQTKACTNPCGRTSAANECMAQPSCSWSQETQRCTFACARHTSYAGCTADSVCAWGGDSCVVACGGHGTPDGCVHNGCTWELEPVARCVNHRAMPNPQATCPLEVSWQECSNIVGVMDRHLCQFYYSMCLPRCELAKTGNECLANPACALVHASKCITQCAARHNTEEGCNADAPCRWSRADGICTEQCPSTAAPACEMANADCATQVIPDIGVTCQKRCRAYPTPQLCAAGEDGGCAWNATSALCARAA